MSQHPSVRDPGGVLTILYVPLLIYTVSDNGTNNLHLSFRICLTSQMHFHWTSNRVLQGAGSKASLTDFSSSLYVAWLPVPGLLPLLPGRTRVKVTGWLTPFTESSTPCTRTRDLLTQICMRASKIGTCEKLYCNVNSSYKPHGHFIYLSYILHKSIYQSYHMTSVS